MTSCWHFWWTLFILVQTSLNSGFKVLFLIWVLHLPFFPMSGFKHLQNDTCTECNLCCLLCEMPPLYLFYLHFDIWVRVAISIHSGQMDAAHDPHHETTLLRVVHEGDQNPAALLCLCAILPGLKSEQRERKRERKNQYLYRTDCNVCMNFWRNLSRLDMLRNSHCLIFVERYPPGSSGCRGSLRLLGGTRLAAGSSKRPRRVCKKMEGFLIVSLTGTTLSRQTLKFFFWFIFSFFSATRVSPINSLCPNLSSSQTESLWKIVSGEKKVNCRQMSVRKQMRLMQWSGLCVTARWVTHLRVLRCMSSSVRPW